MTPVVAGAAAGAVLAYVALAFGFWGFLLTASVYGNRRGPGPLRRGQA